MQEVAHAIGAKSDIAKIRRVSLRPGARLIREWAGEVHEVLVTEDGYEVLTKAAPKEAEEIESLMKEALHYLKEPTI